MNLTIRSVEQKIMSKDVVEKTFQTKFFDQMAFLLRFYANEKNIWDEETKKLVCEQPLKKMDSCGWV
jgi:hypothetical protein